MSDQTIAIELRAPEVLSYAASYNGTPVVESLEIRPTSAQTYADVIVTLSLTSLGEEWAQPWKQRVELLGPAGVLWNAHSFAGFGPDVYRLLEQREQRHAELTVVVTQGEAELARCSAPVLALASSSWVFTRPLQRSAANLAAFVQPQDPALAPVLTAASARLAAAGLSSSLEGYQSENPERVDQLVDALYEAVRERAISYSNPPPNWDLLGNPDTAGQRVRLPSEVLSESLATCLDSTVLMASLIEAIGLRPIIVVIPGHAFVGYWRLDSGLGRDDVRADFVDPVVTLRDGIAQVQLGMISVIETTTLCGGPQSRPAGEARSAAKSSLQGSAAVETEAGIGRLGYVDAGEISAYSVLVDVADCRQRSRILPLPVRRTEADGTVSVIEYRPSEVTFDIVKKAIADAGGGTAAGVLSRKVPLRMKRWQDALLDLSRRNPLLNYRFPAASCVPLFIPEQAMGTVEDLLQTGQALQLLPAPTSGERPIPLSSQRTTPAELDDRIARLLVTSQALLTSLPDDVFATRLRRMLTNSRSIVEETGSNGLYLAIGMVSWLSVGAKVADTAPLILVPVVLKPSDRNRRFSLEIDQTGSITPNFSLAERLKQEFQLDLPKLVEPEIDQAGIDIDGLIAYVRQEFLKAGLNDFRVDPACVLGFFDFSTYRLWKDLQEHWPRFMESSPLVKHLVETPTESFSTDPQASITDATHLDDFAATLPVLADASQARAVQQAMSGATFVLQGPPGSGKSQTITNLLARALHSGKRVLFVAEKAGALGVVRDRLAGVGLGAFGLNLHDKGMRPADVRRQLSEALDAAAATDRIGFEAAQRDIDRAMGPLQQYPRQLHATGALGESAYSARNKLLAVTVESQIPVPAPVIAALDLTGADELRRRFRDLRDVVVRSGAASANPWSFARAGSQCFEEDGRGRFSDLVEAVNSALQEALAQPGASEFLRSVEALDELTALADLSGRTIDLPTVDAAATAAAAGARAHVLATIDGFGPERLFPGATAKTLETPVQELRTALEQASASFFIGRAKRVRAVAARVESYLAGAAVPPESLSAMLADIEKLQSQSRDYLDYLRAMPGVVLPPGANLLDAELRSAVSSQIAVLERDVELARSTGSHRSVRLRALIASGVGPSASIGRLAHALSSLLCAVGADAGSIALWRSSRSIFDALAEAAAGWVIDGRDRDFLQLRRWLELRDNLAPIELAGLEEASRQITAGLIPAEEIDMAFERGFLDGVRRKQIDDQALDAFDGARHDVYAREFAKAAGTLRHLSPGVLADDMITNRGFQPGAAIGAVGELRRELGKQRGFKPIRRLLRDHWSVITRVTPLVLAVPDALVRFVDGDLEPFDLIVFDEASQIKVAHAIGALGRGRAAIIVGDSKQMPPTSVAQLATSASEESEEDSEGTLYDEESILTECLRAWVPETYLTWHYRSADESLIAFSNRNYYDSRLNTLPAPNVSRADKGLSWMKVDGRFVRQTKLLPDAPRGSAAERGTNRTEAEAIVREIVRHVNDPALASRSIGVVTLNKPQQELIQNLLLASEDEAVLAALSPEQSEEPLTVWNLETVQGHERDIILISIAFSKDDEGKLSRNFGPLTHTGGERRLNVAVTRARWQVIVFCSFEPEDLNTEGMSRGLTELADYLRTAKYGPEASGSVGATAITPPDRHRDDVAVRLRQRGLRVATEVGLSEFKVDIAVSRSSAPGEWTVGVLTDGEAWSRRATVGDRDSLPIVLLADRMGWPAVARVWTPDWLRDAESVLDRIEAIVDDIESGRVPDLQQTEAAPEPLQAPRVEPSAAPAGSSTAFASAPAVTLVGSLDATVDSGAPIWTPWEPSTRYPSFVLEQLWDPTTREHIVEVVVAIITTEGPVQVGRAARLVGRAHGLSAVREARVKAIDEAIGDSLPRSADGFFFLPGDPDDYRAWSRAEPGTRKIEEISLAEISNVMRHIAKVGLGASRDELVASSAALLGFQRVSAQIRDRIELGVAEGVRRGALRAEGNYFVAT